LLDEHPGIDPMTLIERRARELTLTAMEGGWGGPPYDPFQLAEAIGIETVARHDLDDARLVSIGGNPRIEFNPQRRPARVRFSVAHEIGHSLFADYGERPRYRDRAEHRSDDWQLEVLCNVAAAELLMPAGALPISETQDLSLTHLLDQRVRFRVSSEALLRRVVKLTDRPACVFAAARVGGEDGFRIDYVVGSRAWRPRLAAGQLVSYESVLSRCTAVGFSDHATERWTDEDMLVQAVGVPPYPGDVFPRLVGLLEPAADGTEEQGLRYVRGDAAEPRGEGPAIIAHVVNDRAQRWGGRGFARELAQRFPDAGEQYSEWAAHGERRLGAVHLTEIAPDRWIASMVAQAGYGDSPTDRPRLRLSALSECLASLASIANELHASVHMPLIGTGQGGTPWPRVRDLVLEELADRHVTSTVYVLPDAPMPEDSVVEGQLTLV
jgi:O-acetyl-ADP-ribose deacetylase (regulator of RNase III)